MADGASLLNVVSDAAIAIDDIAERIEAFSDDSDARELAALLRKAEGLADLMWSRLEG